MAKYSSSVASETIAATGQRAWTAAAITAQGGVFRVYEIHFAGETGSSSYYRIGINRPSVAGVGGTAQVCEKLHPSHPTPGVGIQKATFVTTVPTLTANDVLAVSFNGYGGAIRWVAPVDGEVWCVQGVALSQLVSVGRSGSGAISGHVLHEEF